MNDDRPVVKRSKIRIRNYYYLKCRHTVDEYLSRLLYRADRQLWEEMDNLMVAQVKNQATINFAEYQVPIRIEEVKLKVGADQAFIKGDQKAALGTDISTTAQSFEFQYPPTQSFYDNAKD